MELYIAIQ